MTQYSRFDIENLLNDLTDEQLRNGYEKLVMNDDAAIPA